MNINKTSIFTVLIFILLMTALFAQGEPIYEPDFWGHEPPFGDVAFGGNVVTILIFTGILALGFLSFPMGLISIIQSSQKARRQFPLMGKLLICCGITSLLLGFLGTIIGIAGYFGNEFGTRTGAHKIAYSIHYIGTSIYACGLAILNSLCYIFFIAVTLIVFHVIQNKKK
jgi:hypothetical protein